MCVNVFRTVITNSFDILLHKHVIIDYPVPCTLKCVYIYVCSYYKDFLCKLLFHWFSWDIIWLRWIHSLDRSFIPVTLFHVKLRHMWRHWPSDSNLSVMNLDSLQQQDVYSTHLRHPSSHSNELCCNVIGCWETFLAQWYNSTPDNDVCTQTAISLPCSGVLAIRIEAEKKKL